MLNGKFSPSYLTAVNVAVVVLAVVQIIHNERIKRDIHTYKIENDQNYKIRHIIIDHFRAIYLEQHMKAWLEHVKNDFLNTKEANASITIPEAIQKFYTFFNAYKKDVRNYFEQQFIDLPRLEKKAVKDELANHINNLPQGERMSMRVLHKAWDMETEIDHGVEDQLESIYDALDSVNIIADVNFYNHLRKFEDPKDPYKQVITLWQLGEFLHNLNEGLIQHVEKESEYNIADLYKEKVQKRHDEVVNRIHQLNESIGGIEAIPVTTTLEPIATLV